MRFVGRREELKTLQELKQKRSASLVVIRGRRRIGKSRLAEEFANSFPSVYALSGIPPETGITAEMQREEFLRQMQSYELPAYKADDWGDLFEALAKRCQQGPTLVILDEITWMGSADPTFLPKLKTAWDQQFKRNPQLVVIISGSNSAWIEKNILSSTGFFGRVSLRMVLNELPLTECNEFWADWPGSVSAYEKLKILSVTGGIPRYLEELRSGLTAEQNICHLCFQPEGLLFHEFGQIFHDLFQARGQYFQNILRVLGEKHLAPSEIATAMQRTVGGDLSEALDTLTQAGFLARDYTWILQSGRQSKLSRYRIKDNYTRFYLKYIEPIREKIIASPLKEPPSGWHSLMGFQFENLVLNNREIVHNALGVSGDEVVNAGPFLQTQRTRRAGCQIDYLIQSRFSVLFACEIKFHARPVGVAVIEQMQRKMEALSTPKGYSIRPVLIHVNGVSDAVVESQYFSNIIDFSEGLGA